MTTTLSARLLPIGSELQAGSLSKRILKTGNEFVNLVKSHLRSNSGVLNHDCQKFRGRKHFMEYRKLGSLKVSLVGIGCNNFGWRTDAAGTAAVIDAALDAGINFFDTADVYGSGQSEEFLGRALKGRREKAIIATKFGMKMGEGKEGARPEYVRQAVDASLKRLQTDIIDLYQIHRPDPNVPIADTLDALNDAVKAGKVREIGCSNYSAEQIRAAGDTTGPRYFASVQNDYSLLKREAESDVLPECARSGLAFLPYFPLANGLLTGKYRKGEPFPESSRGKDAFGPKIFTPENLERVEALRVFAESHSHSLLELAFSWLAAQPQICSVIAGAKTPDQVRANSAAASWKLTPADLAEIDRILEESGS
jgi:aryl-alcohol dehydrogenase-like predicted oxidoreductase